MFVVFNMPSKWHPLSVTYHTYVTWLDSCRRNMDPSPTVDSITEIGFSDAWKSNFHFCPSGKLFTGFSSLPLLHLPLLHQTLHRCSCAPEMCKVNLFDSVWKSWFKPQTSSPGFKSLPTSSYFSLKSEESITQRSCQCQWDQRLQPAQNFWVYSEFLSLLRISEFFRFI